MAEQNSGNEMQRWTAKRKTAVVLEVLKKQITGVEACRKYGIKQSELDAWTERFLGGGENALRSKPRDDEALHEAELKELRAKVGELVLERDILKKRAAQIDAKEENS